MGVDKKIWAETCDQRSTAVCRDPLQGRKPEPVVCSCSLSFEFLLSNRCSILLHPHLPFSPIFFHTTLAPLSRIGGNPWEYFSFNLPRSNYR